MCTKRVSTIQSVEHALHQKTSVDVLAPSGETLRSTRVRLAVESDLDFLVSEAREFSKFYGTKKELFPGEELGRPILKSLLEQHLFLICEVGGERSGFISGYYLNHPFNPNLRLLAQNFWWVKPAFRTGKSALMLLNAFEDFGRKHADWISFGLEVHSPINRASLVKRGFRPREETFLLEVE